MPSNKGDEAKRPRPRSVKGGSGGERDVGVALRAVYHEAVAEQIPGEMLDLLNKLG